VARTASRAEAGCDWAMGFLRFCLGFSIACDRITRLLAAATAIPA